MEKLILASASPRRKQILEQMGYEFTVFSIEVGENFDSPSSDPGEIAREIAARKARAVFEKTDTGVIVAADTVVVLDGRILGKPADRKEAYDMLTALRGREHQVVTGVEIMEHRRGKSSGFSMVTGVTMKNYDELFIRYYVDTGAPLDKAGAYGIQEKGALLVDSIWGDYYNVVGLPVSRLHDVLSREFGIWPG